MAQNGSLFTHNWDLPRIEEKSNYINVCVDLMDSAQAHHLMMPCSMYTDKRKQERIFFVFFLPLFQHFKQLSHCMASCIYANYALHTYTILFDHDERAPIILIIYSFFSVIIIIIVNFLLLLTAFDFNANFMPCTS